jgi:hypothetical protein
MAYQINKTDGTIVSTVADGQIDSNSTDITLIGKNYSGFGEILNENFIKLLENFSSVSAPTRPIRGQIWFDSTESKVKVYNGLQFVPVSSATISSTRPNTLGVGDLWYNDVEKQLYFFDGTNPILLAPLYSAAQGISGLQVRSILDTLNQTRVITLLYDNGILIGIFAKDSFTPKNAIDGFSGNIDPGFNAGTLANLKFKVTVTNSERLGGADATTYVRRDTSNTIDGQVRITRDLGLVVGDAGNGGFVVNNGNVVLQNTSTDRDLILNVRKGIDQEDAIRIFATSRVVDIYNDPAYAASQVNIGGSLNVIGNLTVQGTTTTINTTNVTVEDKNIVLGLASDGNPTEDTASTGGIILQGATAHAFVWAKASGESAQANTATGYDNSIPALYGDSWNSTEHINLEQDKYYAIDGVPLLVQLTSTPTKTFGLTAAVTSISGVSSFGKQTQINVGPGGLLDPPYITIEDNEIIADNPLAPDLILDTLGDVVLNGTAQIKGVGNPTADSDAATKDYVDTTVRSKPLVFSIDLSDGKPNLYIINEILNNLAPPAEFELFTVARVLCNILSNSSTSLDINALRNPTSGNFLTDLSGSTATALTGLAFNTANINGQPIGVTREIRTFILKAGGWDFDSTITLSP